MTSMHWQAHRAISEDSLSNVRHVVWGIEVLTVPARGETNVHHDADLARLLGEVDCFPRACGQCFEASVR